jgi:tRNA(adenine34) deaminase
MTQDIFFMEKAMQEAELAYDKKTYPVGAIIVNPQGEIIGRGHNGVYSEGDFTSHAEIEAIRDAGSQLMREQNFGACTLYTTWEPCLMCSGAILLAKIARVIWAKDDTVHGAIRYLHENLYPLKSPYKNWLDTLEFHSFNETNFGRRVDSWMDSWNNMKESVVQSRRQEGKRMEESLV